MKLEQLALQTFTIRDYTQTLQDFTKSMKKVAAIGYRSVQISAVGPIPAEDIRSICDDNGLVICATHEKARNIIEETESVAERLEILGSRYTAYPFPHIDLFDENQLAELIRKLDKAGAMLNQAGKVLTYHNHNHEFYRDSSGRQLLERIYDGTKAENLASELDTYWVQAGGDSPSEWISRLSGRLPLLHLKDAGVFVNDEGKPELRFTSVGNGNLNWPELVAQAEKSGTEWFIVEQDGNWVNNDPFEAAADSFRYITEQVID